MVTIRFIRILESNISSDKPHYENYELPSGWKYDLITNVCSKIVDGDHNPPVAQKQISPYIMLSSKNINEDAITNLNDVRYLSKADFDISNNRTKVTKGDVLFTSVGSIGRTCIYDLLVPVAFQRSVTVMTTYIYNRYFKLFLDSPLYQNYVFENARGTAQKGFYINQIENSLIPIPPYNEQIKIVEITEKLLSFINKIEEERNNIIENIYRIKSEILDLAISGKLAPQNSADEPAIELLRKINPAFKPCDNSHYEKLPNGWCVCRLEDICQICDNHRKPINSSERIERKNNAAKLYPYYGATGLVDWIDDFLLDGTYILLGEDGAPFLDKYANKAYIVSGKIWVNNHAHILSPQSDISYLCHYLNTYDYSKCVNGSTRLKLTQADMKNIEILLPPLNEQYRISHKIDYLLNLINTITAEL